MQAIISAQPFLSLLSAKMIALRFDLELVSTGNRISGSRAGPVDAQVQGDKDFPKQAN